MKRFLFTLILWVGLLGEAFGFPGGRNPYGGVPGMPSQGGAAMQMYNQQQAQIQANNEALIRAHQRQQLAQYNKRLEMAQAEADAQMLSPTSNPVIYGFAGMQYAPEMGKYITSSGRIYDPDTGRFLSQEPTGQDGPNLYWYAKNNPLKYVDPDGLSARDVSNIKQSTGQYVEKLNSLGLRYRGSPYVNNFLSSMYDVSGGYLGQPYLGCYDQSYGLGQRLEGKNYDDKWSFYQQSLYGGLHYRTQAISSNPTDPILYLDPWHNVIEEQKP